MNTLPGGRPKGSKDNKARKRSVESVTTKRRKAEKKKEEEAKRIEASRNSNAALTNFFASTRTSANDESNNIGISSCYSDYDEESTCDGDNGLDDNNESPTDEANIQQGPTSSIDPLGFFPEYDKDEMEENESDDGDDVENGEGGECASDSSLLIGHTFVCFHA